MPLRWCVAELCPWRIGTVSRYKVQRNVTLSYRSKTTIRQPHAIRPPPPGPFNLLKRTGCGLVEVRFADNGAAGRSWTTQAQMLLCCFLSSQQQRWTGDSAHRPTSSRIVSNSDAETRVVRKSEHCWSSQKSPFITSSAALPRESPGKTKCRKI
jgi:hypothetical protein